jgi:chromosome segregation ATPase
LIVFVARPWLLTAIVLAAGALDATGMLAQQATTEDRLREALRRSTVELRALQDAQAGMQAKIDELTKQKDDLQHQLDDAQAKLATTPPPEAKPVEDVQALKDEIEALKKQNGELQAGLARWQSSYQEAASVARAKDAEAKKLDASLKTSEQVLCTAKEENTKLIAIANDILHTYETQSFRNLLLGSYEPLIGIKKVQLQNLVQDYEDKMYTAKFTGTETPQPPCVTPGSAAQTGIAPVSVPQPGPAAPAQTRTKPASKAGATP